MSAAIACARRVHARPESSMALYIGALLMNIDALSSGDVVDF